MGLALLWKEAGKGSQEALAELQMALGFGKSRYGIGHTGTLDPFAEGLLCVGTGEGSKVLAPLSGLDKTYEVQMALGASTHSYDSTGEVTWPEKPIDLKALALKLESTVSDFLASKLGVFSQVPPQLSAVHVDGKRAYEWARAGIKKVLKAREAKVLSVQHRSIETLEFKTGEVLVWNFEIRVSSGTYIRSLARDWGLELCSQEGFLTRLIRTQIGPFRMNEGEKLKWMGLADLTELFDTQCLDESAASALRNFGRYKPTEATKPRLLLDPKRVPLAWVHAGTGKIGRVFLSDPLKAV